MKMSSVTWTRPKSSQIVSDALVLFLGSDNPVETFVVVQMSKVTGFQ